MPDGVVGRKMAPKDVCILFPGICEYVKVQGKTDVIFADVIRDLKMGDYPELPSSARDQSPRKREAGGSESEKEI